MSLVKLNRQARQLRQVNPSKSRSEVRNRSSNPFPNPLKSLTWRSWRTWRFSGLSSRPLEPPGIPTGSSPCHPDLDVLPLDGELIDLGEVAADTLGLALDPFPHASETELAEARARLMNEEEAARLAAEDSASRNPFRVLKGGKDD